jgi:sialidase-1
LIEDETTMLAKTTLLRARTNGYWNYRVPGILAAPGGALLVTAEARRGGGGDWDGNDIVLRRSIDEGQSWQPVRRVVACEDYGPGPVSNFVMIADRHTAAVHALYCHNYARVFYMRSDDDGATFSSPVEITPSLLPYRRSYPWRVIATGPGHGIQLSSGRLVVPVWLSDGSGTEFGAGKLGHRPSSVACIYSDDGGATWQRGSFVVHHGDRAAGSEVEIVNPSETVAAELSDGRVLFNIRSESSPNRRLVSISPDGAHRWSTPRFDQALREPVCMASMLALDAGGSGPPPLLFANPDNLENELIPPGGALAHDRKRLAIKISLDQGRTWPISRVLEAGPAGYSDLAQAADGTLWCSYECGMVAHMTDTRAIVVAHFDLEWTRG